MLASCNHRRRCNTIPAMVCQNRMSLLRLTSEESLTLYRLKASTMVEVLISFAKAETSRLDKLLSRRSTLRPPCRMMSPVDALDVAISPLSTNCWHMYLGILDAGFPPASRGVPYKISPSGELRNTPHIDNNPALASSASKVGEQETRNRWGMKEGGDLIAS